MLFLLQNIDLLTWMNTFFLNYDLLQGVNYYLTSTGDIHLQGTLSVTPFFYIIFYFINLYIYRSYLKPDKVIDTLLRSYLLGIIVLIAFVEFTLISSRISGILFISIVILFPKILDQLHETHIKLGYFFTLIFYSSMLYMKMIYLDPNHMLPYESIL